MKVQTSPTILRTLIRPPLAVCEDNECKAELRSDTVRLRLQSKCRTAYLDYTAPAIPGELILTKCRDSFWFDLDYIRKFLRTTTSADVTLVGPSHTPKSRLKLASDGLRVRCAQLNKTDNCDFPDVPTADSYAELTFSNRVFNRLVKAADLYSNALEITVPADGHEVVFSSTRDPDREFFRHTLLGPHDTDNTQTKTFSASTRLLRRVVPTMPPTSPCTITLSQNHLTYRATHPGTNAELSVYFAPIRETV